MTRRILLSLVAACGLLPMADAETKKASLYPPTKVDPVVDKLHGVEITDPYRWLEDADSAATRAWVDKENAYTRSILDNLPGREAIHQRLEVLLEIGSLTAPAPRKGRYFYLKREGKQNQPVLYVRKGLKGVDKILLDPNALAKDGTTALDWWFPSRDGNLLAYGLSKDGNEQSTLRVRDLETGEDLPDMIERTRASSIAWLPEGTGFYYTRYPAADNVPKGQENYHRHVFLHKLGDDPAKDVLVFGEGRQAEDWPNVALSPDGRWLVVTVEQGWSRSEVHFKDCKKTDAAFAPLTEGLDALF
ncbi:MAG TPA: hypothetical protein VGG61_13095, partial [Gemmataceae bacterium]